MAGDTRIALPLTPGQVRVIASYARGLRTTQITQALGTGERSVRDHIARAAKRAQISGRPLGALVHHCYQHGLFDGQEYADLAVRTRETPPQLRLPHSLCRVLGCMAEGLSLTAAANELGITRPTVMQYRKRIYERFRTRELPRAVAMGWQWGHLPIRPTAGAGTPVHANSAGPARKMVVTP
ncbi:LuxR C-terminal-related transcriptional regulator [Streptomyces sp. NPDC005385]|uniref:LuxR C-terminal-related transcriptional regulator n=1 Tax=Streptomyces sp. NPDC005385 TaxID=3157039 RepID=UPI0033AC7429